MSGFRVTLEPITDGVVNIIAADRFGRVWPEGQRGIRIGHAVLQPIDASQIVRPVLGKPIADPAGKVVLNYYWP